VLVKLVDAAAMLMSATSSPFSDSRTGSSARQQSAGRASARTRQLEQSGEPRRGIGTAAKQRTSAGEDASVGAERRTRRELDRAAKRRTRACEDAAARAERRTVEGARHGAGSRRQSLGLERPRSRTAGGAAEGAAEPR